MKKYTLEDLQKTRARLSELSDSEFISDILAKLDAEIAKRTNPKFVKATDEEIKKIGASNVYSRHMRSTDAHFIDGMYGLFERGTDRLLRRHSDLGSLLSSTHYE